MRQDLHRLLCQGTFMCRVSQQHMSADLRCLQSKVRCEPEYPYSIWSIWSLIIINLFQAASCLILVQTISSCHYFIHKEIRKKQSAATHRNYTRNLFSRFQMKCVRDWQPLYSAVTGNELSELLWRISREPHGYWTTIPDFQSICTGVLTK